MSKGPSKSHYLTQGDAVAKRNSASQRVVGWHLMPRLGVVALLGAGMLGMVGCTSHIVPLKPVQVVDEWVPPETASTTQTATAPATQVATTTTAPASQPGWVKQHKEIDPNQTVRLVYRANYQRIWDHSNLILTHMGFRIDRHDYRLGVLTTYDLPSPNLVEPWRRDQTGFNTAGENTVNQQRRLVRVTIKAVSGKPQFYEIGVQVLVERLTNPKENLSGQTFATGSGFGNSSVALQSDFVPGPEDENPAFASEWIKIGHDPILEKKILDKLFEKI